jgi:hypothetical protein
VDGKPSFHPAHCASHLIHTVDPLPIAKIALVHAGPIRSSPVRLTFLGGDQFALTPRDVRAQVHGLRVAQHV